MKEILFSKLILAELAAYFILSILIF